MQVSSLPREAGSSVGKKADGECKKEIVAVSELGDQGWVLVLLLSGEALPVSAAAPRPAVSCRSETAAVLQKGRGFAFCTCNKCYLCERQERNR